MDGSILESENLWWCIAPGKGNEEGQLICKALANKNKESSMHVIYVPLRNGKVISSSHDSFFHFLSICSNFEYQHLCLGVLCRTLALTAYACSLQRNPKVCF